MHRKRRCSARRHSPGPAIRSNSKPAFSWNTLTTRTSGSNGLLRLYDVGARRLPRKCSCPTTSPCPITRRRGSKSTGKTAELWLKPATDSHLPCPGPVFYLDAIPTDGELPGSDSREITTTFLGSAGFCRTAVPPVGISQGGVAPAQQGDQRDGLADGRWLRAAGFLLSHRSASLAICLEMRRASVSATPLGRV
jgi:hypothetical protein